MPSSSSVPRCPLRAGSARSTGALPGRRERMGQGHLRRERVISSRRRRGMDRGEPWARRWASFVQGPPRLSSAPSKTAVPKKITTSPAAKTPVAKPKGTKAEGKEREPELAEAHQCRVHVCKLHVLGRGIVLMGSNATGSWFGVAQGKGRRSPNRRRPPRRYPLSRSPPFQRRGRSWK